MVWVKKAKIDFLFLLFLRGLRAICITRIFEKLRPSCFSTFQVWNWGYFYSIWFSPIWLFLSDTSFLSYATIYCSTDTAILKHIPIPNSRFMTIPIDKLGLNWAKLSSSWDWTLVLFSVDLVSLELIWLNWLDGFSFVGLI